jgi:hypothetical protein
LLRRNRRRPLSSRPSQGDVLQAEVTEPVLPHFSWCNGKNIRNDHKIYQMATIYTKWP